MTGGVTVKHDKHGLYVFQLAVQTAAQWLDQCMALILHK